MLTRILQRFLGLTRLDRLAERATALRGDRTGFQTATRIFDFRAYVSDEERQRIPTSGPVIVVANHPTGAVEGIVLGALLESVRPDVRALSHIWFQRWPVVAGGMILVDPAAGKKAPHGRTAAAKESIDWVRAGGLLTVFPAGEVARFHCRAMRVTDSPWSPGVARILRATRASVLPVHIGGRNSLVFLALSALHPRLGALWLGRELLNKRGKTVRLRIGEPVAFEDLECAGCNREMTERLRQMVDRLGAPNIASRGIWSRVSAHTEVTP